jgi:peptide/nickel transport system substrate-binding protein
MERGLARPRKRLWRAALTVGMVAALATAACQPTPTGPQASPPGAVTFQRGEGGELRLLWWQGPTILNPHLAQGTKDYDAARLILEPLAAIGPDGRPVARGLAAEIPTKENGGVSADNRTVTWKLRTGVKWSDGSDFTADDVVFTWRYMADAATAATTFATTRNVEKVEARDRTTAVVTFKTPQANPYQIFAGPLGMIIQQKQFEGFIGARAKDAPGNTNPIGTGAYKVREFKSNDVVTYEINTQYRESQKPYFKTVQLKTVADPLTSARAVLQTGDADYAWNLQLAASVLKPLIDASQRGEVITADSSSVERLLINRSDPRAPGDNRAEPTTRHPILSDLNVRKALAMASNRGQIAEQIYGAGLTGVTTCNIITQPTDLASPNTRNMDVCRFDMAAANQLMDQAGWTKGADGVRAKGGVRCELVYATTVNAVRQATQAIIKRDWETLGCRVELKSVDAGVFFSSDVANPDTAAKFFTDVEMFTNSYDKPDPEAYLSGWTTEEIKTRAQQWRGANYERWSDRTYDDLYAQLQREVDPAKRKDIIIKMNDRLIEDVVIIPLIARKFPVAAKARDLRGVEANGWDGDLWNAADWHKTGTTGGTPAPTTPAAATTPAGTPAATPTRTASPSPTR